MASKKGYIVYTDYIDLMSTLTDEEAGIIFRAMLTYMRDGNDIYFEDRTMQTIWFVIKSNIERDKERYEKTCERNKTNGAKGGRPKNN